MSKEQEDMIIRAYLGICTLKRCYAKWGRDFEMNRTANLLKEMGETFPFIPEHVAQMAFR